MPYDVDALCRLAERALCCTQHHHAVPVDAEELVALLAEFQRRGPIVIAALECAIASTKPTLITAIGALVEAVNGYIAQRREAGELGEVAPEPPGQGSP